MDEKMKLLVILCFAYAVRGDFSRSCSSKGKVLICKKVKEDLTCENAGRKLLNAERLIMINPHSQRVTITPQCLPNLRTIEVDRSGTMNCSDFAGFPIVIINRSYCTYSTTSTPRPVSGKPPGEKTRTTETTTETVNRTLATPDLVTNQTSTENTTLYSTIKPYPMDGDDKREKVSSLVAAVVTLSILSLLLLAVVFLLLTKKRFCRRRLAKIPPAEDLGSSETIFLRDTSRNPFSDSMKQE
ncbi:uncharacterized protein LOC133200511 [Saccostrea echinata]|uniref:uncharacterized protein LOC133200511 n=1 Tax=Saccostrea echinata TaxID=191078 RepID=UPI002A7FA84D|nr:uncharacterized protein LOC133200511 [Saccostrea echinata]